MAKITKLLRVATDPMMVKSHPFPMASMIGDVTPQPMLEKMFRTKLLSATPEEDRLGINSVSMVIDRLKINMEPIPKKKLATIGTSQ